MEDGANRPFQKYFIQPSSIVILVVLTIAVIGGFLFLRYERSWVFPKKTQKEIVEMSERMKKWNEKFGKYPTDLNQLIGNSPMRQEWKKDAWNKPYEYYLTDNGKGFLIISAGPDGKFGTGDDIKSE